MFYKKLIESKSELPYEKIQRWNEDLNIQANIEKYLRKLESSRTCSINNKWRSFNYNFFMRNVPYESKLIRLELKKTINVKTALTVKKPYYIYIGPVRPAEDCGKD